MQSKEHLKVIGIVINLGLTHDSTQCDRKLPICTQCIGAGMRCNYPESNKRGFPPGYIAALEKRLLETELALFDTLHTLSFLQPTPFNDRGGDLNTGQEQPHNLDTRRVLAKQSITQTKAEKVAEWERLPIGTSTQRLEWVQDRMSLVGLHTESFPEQSGSRRQPQFHRSMSSGDLVQLQQPTFLQSGFMHNQDTVSYLSPGGTSDGSMTRDENTMMPPPSRPAMPISSTSFPSTVDGSSSATFPSYQTQTLPPEQWRNSPTMVGNPNQSSWLRLTDQNHPSMSSMNVDGSINESFGSDQSSGGSRAQQVSSTQWRRFF
ncbi:hypothetical protein LTR84_007264 [Exophiala bonariae]|uniref:Zn(2)-C6 fungal-type domain-containing protein n=1 Tax=Exophiala bonariae TaxID=1690606 RepID=A0AAV9N057_9EURO|nr:hypothetical protein LTR84_007264 [Exophiala bonariae]